MIIKIFHIITKLGSEKMEESYVNKLGLCFTHSVQIGDLFKIFGKTHLYTDIYVES